MITTVNLTYSVSGQTITPNQASPYLLASNTVKYVKVQFTLGENWASCDSVKAVWSGIKSRIVTLLDSDGICYVPHELLAKQQKVYVNLTGSDFEEDTLIDRITTYPLYALNVNATAYTDGSETAPITPSQFEQFVEAVKDEVGKIKDIDSVELNADYTLTIIFSDGTETTVGPIRGEQGETGNGIASAVLNDDYTLTLTFTDGTSYTTPSIRGEQGEQGEPGEVTLAQLSAVLPTDTANGAIASFPDGSDLFDYLSCVVNIDPVQAGSGTPSPDNICPITGWTGCEVVVSGVNLFDGSLEQGTFTNSGVESASNTRIRTGFIRVKQGDVSISTPTANTCIHEVYCYDKDNIFVSKLGTISASSGTVTVPNGAQYVRFSMRHANDSNIAPTDAIAQLELGSTATSYQPYQGTTYPITWQTEAGTVYGGTVDLVSGVLTVDRAIVDFGGLSWQYNTTSSLGPYFYALYSDIKSPGAPYSYAIDAICTQYKVVKRDESTFLNSTLCGDGDTTHITQIQVKDTSYTDANTFKTAMNGVKLCYALATTTTYQLTGQQIACLLGQNNVWADCGDVEVKYKADVQRWVEKMLGQ